MRVQYTLPGYEPAPQNGVGAAESRTFQAKLRDVARHESVTWKQVLRLDRKPESPTSLAPPPPPASLEVRDIGAERQRMGGLLERTADSLAKHGSPVSPEDGAKINTMLGLLQEFHSSENALLAYNVNGTGV